MEKQVLQLVQGRQEATLRRLAEEILAAVAAVGAAGEGAASLAEGLAKVADGRLAAETLTLQVLEQNERPEETEEGWLLRLEAGLATAERQSPEEGPGDARVLELSAAEVSEVAQHLAEEGFATLPANLFAPRYLDLSVAVLDRRFTLQARPFAGMTRETHGAAQQRFDRVVESLHRLYLRAAEEGRGAAPTRCRAAITTIASIPSRIENPSPSRSQLFRSLAASWRSRQRTSPLSSRSCCSSAVFPSLSWPSRHALCGAGRRSVSTGFFART